MPIAANAQYPYSNKGADVYRRQREQRQRDDLRRLQAQQWRQQQQLNQQQNYNRNQQQYQRQQQWNNLLR
ncbi:hypothetical protein SynROS8604_03591 [Synechococcus sp. ROS8604]|nr:hypothetical protein SynROS8604_03591 [Synechococcus sp. ROS8604]